MIIGFSKRNELLSRVIKYATKSECSHCYIYDPNSGLVFHAQGLFVHAVSYANFKSKNDIVWETTPQTIDWEWLREQLGKSYGTLTLIGHIIPLLTNKQNPFNDSDYSFTCSELVARCMGIENAERARPDHLLRHLRDGLPLDL